MALVMRSADVVAGVARAGVVNRQSTIEVRRTPRTAPHWLSVGTLPTDPLHSTTSAALTCHGRVEHRRI